jgi:hypothetical protein
LISKKLIITEHCGEQEYSFDYLIEGMNEEKIDKKILEFVKTWYGLGGIDQSEPIDLDNVIIDTYEQTIDFGFSTIKWESFIYSKKDFIKELIRDRNIKAE